MKIPGAFSTYCWTPWSSEHMYPRKLYYGNEIDYTICDYHVGIYEEMNKEIC